MACRCSFARDSSLVWSSVEGVLWYIPERGFRVVACLDEFWRRIDRFDLDGRWGI